jgi:hypothetical protein
MGDHFESLAKGGERLEIGECSGVFSGRVVCCEETLLRNFLGGENHAKAKKIIAHSKCVSSDVFAEYFSA